MLILIETMFLFQEVCFGNEAEYALVLEQILSCAWVAVPLKAAVCRQIMEGTTSEDGDGDSDAVEHTALCKLDMTQALVRNVLPPLVNLIRDANRPFLQAVSTAAVVGLVQRFPYVRSLVFLGVVASGAGGAGGSGAGAAASSGGNIFLI